MRSYSPLYLTLHPPLPQDVICCALTGARGLLPVGARLITPGQVTCIFSDRLPTQGMKADDKTIETLNAQAHTWIAEAVYAAERPGAD